MVSFDEGLMYCAIDGAADRASNQCGFPLQTGFIHRTTGEIIFVPTDNGRVDDYAGMDVAVDMVFDRARLDANPEQWAEIPKYDGPDGGEDAFIHRFLEENNLRMIGK